MSKNDDGAFWSIVAYLISGLVFWGGAGAAGDHFLGTHFLLATGLFLDMGSSLWLIWLRFIRE